MSSYTEKVKIVLFDGKEIDAEIGVGSEVGNRLLVYIPPVGMRSGKHVFFNKKTLTCSERKGDFAGSKLKREGYEFTIIEGKKSYLYLLSFSTERTLVTKTQIKTRSWKTYGTNYKVYEIDKEGVITYHNTGGYCVSASTFLTEENYSEEKAISIFEEMKKEISKSIKQHIVLMQDLKNDIDTYQIVVKPKDEPI